MLNLFHLGAIAAIFSSPVNSSLLLTQANAANRVVQPTTSMLMVTNETLNARAVTEFVVDSNINTPEVAEKVSPSEVAIALAAVGGAAVGTVLIAKKVKPLKQTGLNLGTEDALGIDQASRKLQQKLMRLLHDDRDTASRLLSQIKNKNPNKSINWYVEKVIYDLDRDRGRY